MSEDTALCAICGGTMHTAPISGQVLGRHPVRYFSCPRCHFLRTEKPHWLAEAYTQAIAATDTGIVQRNLTIARQLCCVLPELLKGDRRVLDMAGGTGLLTRLLRDYGFDCYWEDLYCQNVLAAGFGAAAGSAGYGVVTAFEALEHMEDPFAFIRDCTARSATGSFVFTTELFEPPLPPGDWWYLSQATGQHISFFTAATLHHAAQRLGLRFMTHRGLHLMTRLPLAESRYRRLLRQERGLLFDRKLRKLAGLTQADHERMTRRLLEERGAAS